MAESILQSYLTLQHIKVTDESNIENLKKAVTEVKKQLTRKKLNVIPYTLVALDPKIKDTDPVVQEVEGIIIKKWSTFKNSVTATKDKSTTYVRAVILESLNQLASGDVVFAALVWHAARDVVKHYQLDAEKESITPFLQHAANTTEVEGQRVWSLKRDIITPDFEVPQVSFDQKVVSQKLLVERLHAATGPSSVKDGANSNNEDANRYWPNQNQNWSGDFGDIAGKAIATSINSVLKSQNSQIEQISVRVNESLKGLGPMLSKVGKSLMESAEALNNRTQLIWWKQALYSPRINASYRGLSLLDTAIITVFDLADQVTPIYPVSVDYLLRETLKDLQGEEADKKKSLGDWLGEIPNATDGSKSALAKHVVENDVRKTLLMGLANAASKGPEHFFNGIDSKEEVSLSDLAVWLFHGLQAHALATAK
jgi:hypothetical protein